MNREWIRKQLPTIWTWLLVALGFFWLSIALQGLFGEEQLLNLYYSNRILWILSLIFLKAWSIIIAPISGAWIYAVVWSILPFRESVLFLSVGNLIGTTAFYYLWRSYWDKALLKFFGKWWLRKAHEILDYISTPKWYTLANIFLAPLADLLCLAAWMSGLKYTPYIIISMIFWTLIMVGALLGADYLTWLFFTVFWQ